MKIKIGPLKKALAAFIFFALSPTLTLNAVKTANTNTVRVSDFMHYCIDSTPAPQVKVAVTAPKAPKAPKPPKESTNLFKSIGNFFKFRSNTDNRNDARNHTLILTVLDSLAAKDSIVASSKNVKWLIEQLSDTTKQKMNELGKLITEIKKSDSIQAAKNAKAISDLKDSFDSAKKSNPSLTPINKEPTDSDDASDNDLQKLMTQITQTIQKDKNDQEDEQKTNTLANFSQVELEFKDSVFTHKASGSAIVKRYQLKLKNKIEVVGFYNSKSKTPIPNLHLSRLNTLIYNDVVINEKTGWFHNPEEWNQTTLIDDALKDSCKVILTITGTGTVVENFMRDVTEDKSIFLHSLDDFLERHKLAGINISFTDLKEADSRTFTDFISLLSRQLKPKNYLLYITIPCVDGNNGYAIQDLSPFADKLIIDFSTNLYNNISAPMDPLSGNMPNNLTTVLGYYTEKKIPASKLIICLPYKGTKWSLIQDNKEVNQFIQYLNYAEIKQRYIMKNEVPDDVKPPATLLVLPVVYDKTTNNALIQLLDKKYKKTVGQIWFDDETTLAKKYDFILKSKVGGVAVNALGCDGDYPELWQTLTYKFRYVDTVYLADSMSHLNTNLTFFQRVRAKLALYEFILQNPCEICFETIKNDKTREEIDSLITILRIPEKIKNDPKKQYRNESTFEYVERELRNRLIKLTVITALIFLAILIFYIHKIKNEPDDWRWKGTVAKTLMAIGILLIVFFVATLFTDNDVPYFGAVSKAKMKARKEAKIQKVMEENKGTSFDTLQLSKDSAMIVMTDSSSHQQSFDDVITASDKCVLAEDKTCYNIPIYTIMLIVGLSLLAGGLLVRVFILPILQRGNEP